MIVIALYKDLHGEFTLSYIKVINNEAYQFIKFHLESWEVAQYMGGN